MSYTNLNAKANFRFPGTLLLSLALAIGVAAQDQTGQKTDNPEAKKVESPEAFNQNPNYKIGPGDLIDVIVTKNETLSRSGLRVSNTGTVQLPMLDAELSAACMTERELAEAIKEKYRKYLVEPSVTVAVKEFNSKPVAVIGGVNSPGRFQLQREYRLVELLALVNGPSANAGPTAEILRYGSLPHCEDKTLVFPNAPSEEIISVVLADAFTGGERVNPTIFPGDIVRVSQADLINAYIQGNVRNGMAIPLKEPVTLTQAVAMAGGLSSGAQTEKVRIRRPIPGSINRTEMLVNLKEINQGKRDDVLLQANDIVEIPGPSGIKKVFTDIYKTVVPTITSLPMRVVY